MSNSLLFNFDIDKTKNEVHVVREFDADVTLVWKAWTTPEILEQWWAPKPFVARTKSMNFTPGGMWLYYMEGPQGERHYCKADYLEIVPEKMYRGLDAFCDENGNINEAFPRTEWTVTFEQKGNRTTVNIVARYTKLEDLEQIISLGFKEGFTMALGNLDEVLAASK